ncbi:MAG: hypothetical protein ACTS2F_20165 [Thainema sp.]
MTMRRWLTCFSSAKRLDNSVTLLQRIRFAIGLAAVGISMVDQPNGEVRWHW